MVAWTSDQDGEGDDVFVRRFNPDGSPVGGPLGGELRVNTTTVGDQSYPDVAVDLAGEKFIVTWSDSQGDLHGYSVYGRAFEGSEGLVVTRGVGHPGMAARPFLRPAFDSRKKDARDQVGEVIKDKALP